MALAGNSKYISDWTSAGFDMDKGHHFVSLHVKALLGGETTGVTCVAECVPTQGSPTPAFNDDEIIMQVQDDGATTGIKITASKEGANDKTIVIDLSGVTLAEE